MHEKRGVIEEGRTPPEKADEEKDTKEASTDQFDHTQSRLADAVNDSIGVKPN